MLIAMMMPLQMTDDHGKCPWCGEPWHGPSMC